MKRRLATAGALVSVLLALAAGLTGCQGSDSPAELPDGVSVSVYQPRPDVAKNRIAITVHNDGDVPVIVTGASLGTTFFVEDFTWGPDRTATVPVGYAVDLRIDIPAETDCADVPPEHLVTISWLVGEKFGTSIASPDDPFHVLDLLHDAACLLDDLQAVAGLTATSLTAPEAMPAPADLLIAVDPTGEPGSVSLDTIHSTTLLSPADENGVGVAELPLDVTLDAGGPREVHIAIVPNRCDAHALAEDKVGTRMPLYVTSSTGSSGRLVLSASDELRAQMYAFYSSYCGL